MLRKNNSIKKRMQNKGFTLLEVLAVIIVLAVIALITIPIVTSTMKDAKKNSFKTSMTNLVKAADNYYADRQLEIDKVMTFCFGLQGSNCTSEKLNFSGKEPSAGKLIINPDGEISLVDMTNGTYYANYDSNSDDEISITEDNEVLTRDELTQALKDLKAQLAAAEKVIALKSDKTELAAAKKELQAKDTALQTQLNSTTTIANTANNTANSLNTGMLNKTYPVGSIYISYSSTNPGSLFGGTWVSYGVNRTLMGINSGTAGGTGGSSSTSIKLSTANLPSHNHSIPSLSGSTNTAGNHTHITSNPYPGINNGTTYGHIVNGSWIFGTPISSMSTNGNHSHSLSTNASSTGYSGSGSAFSVSTQSPYITVYMWRRTA